MTGKRKTLFIEAPLMAALALAAGVALSAGTASAKYMADGAVQNGITGGWVTPSDGVCGLGLHADGTMDVDLTITNKRDCDARAIASSGTTKAQCTTLGTSGNDGAVHVWAGSSTCVTVSAPFPSTAITGTISLKDLDRTAAMCVAKGGYLANDTTHVSATATGGCIAYGWQYRGQDANGAPLAFGAHGTAAGAAGFCSAYLDTGLGAAACPTVPGSTSGTGTATSTQAFGYIVHGGLCDYQFGIKGNVDQNNSRGTWSAYKNINGVTVTSGTPIDLSSVAAMGDCLAAGYAWTNWVPMGPGSTTGAIAPNIITAALFDLTQQAVDADEGCLHCHSQNGAQYNGPAERWKDSYLKTGHKNMLRKVTAGKNWAGPCAPGDTPNADGLCVYTTDGTNPINFMTASDPFGKVTVGGVDQNLYYIYGDWMAQYPTLAYGTNGYGPTIGTNNGYSCYACHSTGAKDNSNPGVQSIGTAGYAGVEPQASFPGISLNTANPKWDLNGINCSRCHNATVPAINATQVAASSFTTTAPTSGGMGALASGTGRTNLCFGCHQSIAKVWPSGASQYDPTLIPTGVSHGAAAGRDFNGHVLGNSFLNSVHAEYAGAQTSNGSIKLNSLGKYDLTDPNGTTEYASIFKGYTCWQTATGNSPAKTKADGTEIKTQTECDALYACSKTGNPTQTACTAAGGTWATTWRADASGDLGTTQGTCSTCHDVHNSLFIADQAEAALRKKCDDCHVNNSATGATDASAPQVNLATIGHPTGGGTPFDSTKYESPCIVCHMATQAKANGNQNSMPVHVWRINTSASYNTFPTTGQFYGGTCSVHTGAIQNAPSLPVVYLSDTSSANCTGASGAWTAVTKDRNAQVAPDGTYTNAVWVDLDLACGQCHGGSLGAGATANNAPYLTKAELATYADGMHNNAPTSVNFGYWLGSPNTLAVGVYAFADCGGTCGAFDWDWGDGTAHSSGASASHTYAGAGTYAVTLTVTGNGQQTSKTKNVAVYAPDNGPSVSGTACSSILGTGLTAWAASLTDNSTDDNGVTHVTVNWGDGTMLGQGAQGVTLTHAYKGPGTYTITHKALDTIGQQAIRTCTVSVAYFTIGGTVQAVDSTLIPPATVNVPSASVTVTNADGVVVRKVYTAIDGTFSAGSLKPGTYTLSVARGGYTFPAVAPITVGPSSTSNTVAGTKP
jgi:PKD repeat protein